MKRFGISVKKKLCGVILLLTSAFFLHAQQLDFLDAVIVTPAKTGDLTKKAVQMLQDEVKKHTSITLPVVYSSVSKNKTAIVVGLETEVSLLQKQNGTILAGLPATVKDGYKIATSADKKSVLIAGYDGRGVIYGVGYLLRKMEMRKQKILIPETISVSSSPKFYIRGQSITNHFDSDSLAKNKPVYEQYLRELMYFGMNHVAVTTAKEAKLCSEYGLEVSLSMPNVNGDFESPDGIRKELEKREAIFYPAAQLHNG